MSTTAFNFDTKDFCCLRVRPEKCLWDKGQCLRAGMYACPELIKVAVVTFLVTEILRLLCSFYLNRLHIKCSSYSGNVDTFSSGKINVFILFLDIVYYWENCYYRSELQQYLNRVFCFAVNSAVDG